MIWFLVAVGSALGGVARHGLNHVIHQRQLSSTFPLGIFLINVVGSTVIGLLGGFVASGRWSLSFEARTFLIVGVLGGLAALVLGGTAVGAAKLGLFAWLALMFKKAGKLVIVAIIAVAAFFKKIASKLFGGGERSLE